MASVGQKYQALANEEDNVSVGQQTCNDREVINTHLSPHQPSLVTEVQNVDSNSSVLDAPPPYDDGNVTAVTNYVNESPPLYTEIVKLPTYYESENVHGDESEELEPTNRSMFLFWLHGRNSSDEPDEDQVGSQVGFIFAFLITFIFNWIGFVIAYCMSSDLSSHYGAISGFGLSLVKWGFVMRHSSWSKDYVNDNPWFFYVFLIFGWLVFLRGIIAYARLHHYTRRGAINDIPNNHLM